MSVLVMDGVRRRPEGATKINRYRQTSPATAAVLDLSAGLFGQNLAFDGLSKVETAPSLATTSAIPTAQSDNSMLWRYASWATVPMLAAAAIIGTKAGLNFRAHQIANTPAVAAPAASPAPAPVVAAAPAVKPVDVTQLQNLVDSISQGGTYSLYVKDLKDGRLAVSTPDRVMYSASLYKLFVANMVYQRIDAGQLSYSSPAGGGTGNTVEGCLNLMITISDNGCGRALGGNIIGWDNLTALARNQGYNSTNLSITYTQTSARDVAALYERLYAGKLLSPDSTSRFFQLLKAQQVNNRLPQGLPAGTTIAHKTGDLDGFLHDAGIIYGPKTDYLVVMMGQPGANPSDFAAASQKLWNYFSQ